MSEPLAMIYWKANKRIGLQGMIELHQIQTGCEAVRDEVIRRIREHLMPSSLPDFDRACYEVFEVVSPRDVDALSGIATKREAAPPTAQPDAVAKLRADIVEALRSGGPSFTRYNIADAIEKAGAQ